MGLTNVSNTRISPASNGPAARAAPTSDLSTYHGNGRSSCALVLCAVLLTSVALLSSGCFGRGNKVQKGAGNSTTIGAPKSAKDEKRAAEAAAAEAQKLVPGPVLVVGRVIAIDQRTLTTLIAVAPYSVLPTNFKGSILISRTDDLRPTARLEATPYLRGRTLGARLLSGRPQIGDEVVLAPATP